MLDRRLQANALGTRTQRLALACAPRFKRALAAAVERGAAEQQLLAAPEHPYAEGLISAARGHRDGAGRLMGIPGRPPRLEQAPQGCSFAPRCPRAIAACAESLPELTATGRTDHAVACYVPTSRG